MGVTVPDPSDPRDYRHIVHMQDDGEEPQRPPLSWRDWCEIAVLAVFVSGCSAGLTLGLDRALVLLSRDRRGLADLVAGTRPITRD
jgi:hypothetical protein